MADCNDLFKKFMEKIVLTPTKREYLRQARDALRERIKNYFVNKIKETGAPIIGLSGFLTLAFDAMKETVEAITTAGLRDKVKIMIGGGQIDEAIRNYTGADAYGRDAMAAVSLSRQWTT